MDTLLRSSRWLLIAGFLLVVAFIAVVSFSRSAPPPHRAATNVAAPPPPSTTLALTASEIESVKALADANHDGVVSDTEALLVTLDVAEAPDKTFDQVKKFDMNADGRVDTLDITMILSALDTLAAPK